MTLILILVSLIPLAQAKNDCGSAPVVAELKRIAKATGNAECQYTPPNYVRILSYGSSVKCLKLVNDQIVEIAGPSCIFYSPQM